MRYRRSYDTFNNAYRVYDSLTTSDVEEAARKYFIDEALVVTTLSHDKLPDELARLPALASFASSAQPVDTSKWIVQKTELPQLTIKLLFDVGSAYDPKGKEGLAQLTASMIAEAGSKTLRIDEINKALYPMAGSFVAQVDKEMTALTMGVHRDNWPAFAAVVLPQLLEPGFRQEDFDRLRTSQLNALTLDLRSNNEEELGKEWLQNRVFAGTAYGHTTLGTVEGLGAITLDDVKGFARQHYTVGNLHCRDQRRCHGRRDVVARRRARSVAGRNDAEGDGHRCEDAARARCRHHCQGHAGHGDFVRPAYRRYACLPRLRGARRRSRVARRASRFDVDTSTTASARRAA